MLNGNTFSMCKLTCSVNKTKKFSLAKQASLYQGTIILEEASIVLYNKYQLYSNWSHCATLEKLKL